MKKPLLAAMVMALTIGACGRLNPMNWFGESSPAPVVAQPADVAVVDPRPLVQQVVALRVEETGDGAIVRATGLPPTQGYWQPALIARPVAGGVLVYDFRILPPPAQSAVGSQASREVTVAAALTRAELAGINRIVVQGELGALSSGR